MTAFLAAAQAGDFVALEELFTEDVVSRSDGAAVAGAARFPLVARARVAKFIAKVGELFWADTATSWVEADGQRAVLVWRDGAVVALVTASASVHGIDEVM
jgi:RNA polymerase sigma-70 factor (ECF subfamily)